MRAPVVFLTGLLLILLAGCGEESPVTEADFPDAPGAERDIAQVAEPAAESGWLPEGALAEGWTQEGEVAVFDEKTIFNHINGEAEIYFPYGFEEARAARYVLEDDASADLAADVYKMGSLLDAFGIYSNYRTAGTNPTPYGAGGQYSAYQLIFYQGPYFVRIVASGNPEQTEAAMLDLGEQIGDLLPGPDDPPEELELLDVRGVDQDTLQYVAESLLGYSFFPRGLVANLNDELAASRIFVVFTDSVEVASDAMEQYKQHLIEKDAEAEIVNTDYGTRIVAQDPLHGRVVVQQAESYIVGRTKIPEQAEELVVLQTVLENVAERQN